MSPEATPEARAKIQQFMQGDSVFIENAGQWPDSSIKFALDSRGANVGLTDHGPRFQLFRTKPGLTPAEPSDRSDPSDPPDQTTPPPPSEMHEFALAFDGAATVAPAGRDRSDRKFNYLVGDAANHREGVGSFDTVWYENLYPGISLEMTGRRSGVKYNFHVAPGADWRVIRLRYEGIDGLALKDDGTLDINIAEGWPPLSDGAPYIYQEVNGEKRIVAGRFTFLDGHTYGFEVTGDYDPTLPLVIDPEVEWGTYLGGSGSDGGAAIAADGSGNFYITGYTSTSGWVSGGWDTTLNNGGAGNDGYVVKLNSAGAHEWSSYLGGTEQDSGRGVAVDSSGACYVTGYTRSSGWVSGGWDVIWNNGDLTKDGEDGFVVKLSSAGYHEWSTYIGGKETDFGNDIAVDASGACYVTGDTNSSGWVSGGWDTTLNDTLGISVNDDGFVVKLSSAGGHEWSTYLGGTERDNSNGIVVDASGACYVTGETNSSGWVSGGWDVVLNNGVFTNYDGFVVKLSSAGGHEWSTYLGGGETEYGYAIAVNSSGACYATGRTNSFGWVSGGWDTTLNDGGFTYYDGYVVKLNSTGGHQWSTYLGGTDADSGVGIAADSSGACYVTGSTESEGWTSHGWDTSFNGGTSDAYVAKLNDLGMHQWSAFLGGTASDSGSGIAVDSAGANLWVTGTTSSSDGTFSGWQTVYSGNGDAFVVKVAGASAVGSLQVTLTPAGAVAAGARWRRVTTSTWRNSGDTETDIPAGPWDIEFKDIYGWAPPEVHTVVVPPAGTATDMGVYIPVTLDVCWSTYLGGTSTDSGQGIAVDGSGACYATGYTESSGWVSGGWDVARSGIDGYAVKLNSAGVHQWSTYLGGTGGDEGYGIAVDSSGASYVTGRTESWLDQ